MLFLEIFQYPLHDQLRVDTTATPEEVLMSSGNLEHKYWETSGSPCLSTVQGSSPNTRISATLWSPIPYSGQHPLSGSETAKSWAPSCGWSHLGVFFFTQRCNMIINIKQAHKLEWQQETSQVLSESKWYHWTTWTWFLENYCKGRKTTTLISVSED